MPHRVLGPQVVATGTNFADPVHGKPLVIERDAATQDPLEHSQCLDVDDEFFVRRQ